MPRKKRSASPFELMDDDFDDNSSQSSRNGNPPIQRNAANARERARMRVLSSAFGRLKTKLPNIPADTKLSKLDTLRLATMYIKQLKTVVEGGPASPASNGETMEGSLNQNGNNATNCYLNFNSGVQSMNWPFGFHHHLANSSLIRSTSSTSLVNNNNNHSSSNNNNWSPSEEQPKTLRYDSENYEHHHQPQTTSFMPHTTLTPQHNNHQHNHWYSETPSPELDSTSSTCLTFENTHLQHHQPEHNHHHQQQLHNEHHQHHQHHNLSHSSTFQHLQHDFQHHHIHHHQQHQAPPTHHLHQNAFVNTSNFQSTSIR